MNRRVINLISLLVAFLLMAAAAITRSGMLLGHKTQQISSPSDTAPRALTVNHDGTVTVNTSSLAEKAIGYAGPVPVEITIADGKISTVTPLENDETPGFFKRVLSSGILDSYTGKTPEEALSAEIDGVTGATYSSKALIANVRAGLQYYTDTNISANTVARQDKGVEFYAALVVLLMAATIPLFTKNIRYRLIQQILNAGVLGFWSGTFVDYTMMLGIMANGLTAIASIIPLMLLVIAFIYPLAGKEGYYCAWVCPLGSIQELALRCNPRHRLHMRPGMVKALGTVRRILWAALMLCLWTGAWISWIDYELFTAFLVREAAAGVIAAGIALLILSAFIPRPYCRFICPTGTLLHLSQDTDS